MNCKDCKSVCEDCKLIYNKVEIETNFNCGRYYFYINGNRFFQIELAHLHEMSGADLLALINDAK